jgi:hypothetical protein
MLSKSMKTAIFNRDSVNGLSYGSGCCQLLPVRRGTL